MEQSVHPQLICCSILKKELQFILQKNCWPYFATYLPSSLHIDMQHLARRIQHKLAVTEGPKIVLFGTCHPRMDQYMRRHGATRIHCQNCIDLLLGNEQFSELLQDGAFFLLEEWAHTWERIISAALGADVKARNEVLRDAHRYLLCIRTPCSNDFSAEAAAISTQTQLPVHWMEVTLDHMETKLSNAFEQCRCQRLGSSAQ